MPFVTEYLSDGVRVVLSGHVTVAEAAPLHAALLELAGTEGRVVIDESRVAGFDLSLLQLVLAVARARRAAGRALSVVEGPVAARLAQLSLADEITAA